MNSTFNITKIIVYLTHPHVPVWNFSERQKAGLQRFFPQATIEVCPNSKTFLDGLPEADVALVWFFKREWMDRAPKLKLLATPAAGRDWIEVPEGADLPISHGSFHGSMMAESVVGAALYFLKAFPLSARMQKEKKWARIKISEKLGSLYKSRVTILGFGNIGQAIGKALKPFGCAITGVKRTPCDPPDWFDAEDRLVYDLPTALADTDHLILTLPGGDETTGLLDRECIGQLPAHCYLYNVGRGNAVREGDLVDALERGNIAGAYLDVFETEPLPETSKLWDMDNVLIQPHLSAASPQYLDLFVEEFGKRYGTDSKD